MKTKMLVLICSWWNSSAEVLYYIANKDMDGELLHGDNAYKIHCAVDELPIKQKHRLCVPKPEVLSGEYYVPPIVKAR